MCKWFKTGVVFESEFFEKDIRAVDKALDIIASFNELGIASKIIKLNIPEVWTFVESYGSDWGGSKSLQEPFVQNYQKFNSNTVCLRIRLLTFSVFATAMMKHGDIVSIH